MDFGEVVSFDLHNITRCRTFFFVMKQTTNKTKNRKPDCAWLFTPPKTILPRVTFWSNYSYKSLGLCLYKLGTSSNWNFAHSSLQNCFSSFKFRFRLCTAIFKSFYRFSAGLRSGLWLGHSRTFHCFSLNHWSDALAVCLVSLSCWKVNFPVPVSKLWQTQTGFPQGFFCI